MWVRKPESLKRLKTPELDEIVELGDGEKVQVTKDVGETLVNEFDAISEHKTQDGG